MDLSKLPPFVAMSLGLLGCVAEPCLSTTGIDPETDSGSSTTYVGPCLSPPLDTSGTTDESETFTTSACLSPPEPETDTDPSTGTGTGTSSGSDSGTSGSDSGTSGSDSGTSGSDSGSDSGTSGMMADEPLPPTRAAAVERMRSRGTLPADVLDRLQAITSRTKG